MKWLALSAALLVPDASAVAQEPLSAQESLIAYCHGAWSAQSLTIDQLIGDACAPSKPAAHCQKVKAELGARQTKISRSLDALNDALLKRGLISEQGWVGPAQSAGANQRRQLRTHLAALRAGPDRLGHDIFAATRHSRVLARIANACHQASRGRAV